MKCLPKQFVMKNKNVLFDTGLKKRKKKQRLYVCSLVKWIKQLWAFIYNEEVMWSGNVPFSFCILWRSVNPMPCASLYVTGRRNLNNGALQNRLDYLNNVATLVVFATTILNFFISTFAMQSTGYFPWLMMRIHWRFCSIFITLSFFVTELHCFFLDTL